jgi:hypothetical protein
MKRKDILFPVNLPILDPPTLASYQGKVEKANITLGRGIVLRSLIT